MVYDVYYSTISNSKNYITTVDNADIASDMCLKNNAKLPRLNMSLGAGNMFFIERN